ncbi:methyltransferase [Klebsiella oxytoca]
MSKLKKVQPPKCDIKLIYDVTMSLYVYPAIIIAHRIGLFEFIENNKKSFQEICDNLKLNKRPAEALLATLLAAHLICRKKEAYYLSKESREFLIKQSPNYFGYFWDMMYENRENFSLDMIHYAISNNCAPIYNKKEIFDSHKIDKDKLVKFTQSMHSVSMASASVWPSLIPLGKYKNVLDIGGGSGAHSIGIAAKWQNLKCTVFDLPDVCSLAMEFINEYEFNEMINTKPGNMWIDSFPETDIHLYSNVLHDWPEDKVEFLLKKSHSFLPKEGMIIIHEILYNDNLTGPLSAAASSLVMLGWTEGKQYSGREFTSMLVEAGFQNIKIVPAYGYHSLITAHKL